jgi:organic hydroperoxide reductase OsmC/OhrA
MTVIEREATIRWLSNPPQGVPHMTVGSGSLHSLPLSMDPDASHPLATSPAELLAGAIGAIFAWFVAQELVNEGAHPRQLTTLVTLTMSDHVGGTTNLALTGMVCKLLGRVPQIGQERLDAVVKVGMSRCVESLGLRPEGLTTTVEAVLEGA